MEYLNNWKVLFSTDYFKTLTLSIGICNQYTPNVYSPAVNCCNQLCNYKIANSYERIHSNYYFRFRLYANQLGSKEYQNSHAFCLNIGKLQYLPKSENFRIFAFFRKIVYNLFNSKDMYFPILNF